MALYNNIVKCFFKRNKHILGVIICLIIFAWQPLCAASQSQKLLIINSYNESAPWVQDYITQFLIEAANTYSNRLFVQSSQGTDIQPF